MNRIQKIYKDNLYRNSSYLILNSVVMSLLGFLFWFIATRTFASSSVGIATAIISAITFIGQLSLLGFNISLLRYQKFNKEELNFSVIIVSLITAILMSTIFIIFVDFISPDLAILNSSLKYAVGFIVFGAINTIFILLNPIFISDRKSHLVLVKNTIFSVLKVLILLLTITASGLLFSWYFSAFLAVLFSLFFIKIKFKINFSHLKEMFNFSLFNYLSSLSLAAPASILPLITLSFLGASQAAYFYIVWTICGILLVVPAATAQNFLTESSMKIRTWNKEYNKALKFFLIILGLGIISLLVLGKFILNLFNAEYVVAYTALIILALAAIPYGLNQLKVATLNIKHKIKPVLLINASVAITTLILALILANKGINYIALSWLIGNTIGLFIGRFFK